MSLALTAPAFFLRPCLDVMSPSFKDFIMLFVLDITLFICKNNVLPNIVKALTNSLLFNCNMFLSEFLRDC